jgi:hypothetical protein
MVGFYFIFLFFIFPPLCIHTHKHWVCIYYEKKHEKQILWGILKIVTHFWKRPPIPHGRKNLITLEKSI